MLGFALLTLKNLKLYKKNLKFIKAVKKVPALLQKLFFGVYTSIFDKNLILITIFFLALFLRELGTHPGFLLFHPDEPSIVGGVERVIINHDFKPVDYAYGGFLSYVYAAFAYLTFIPFMFIYEFFDYILYGTVYYKLTTQLKGFTPLDPSRNHIYYWTRYETALLCSLTVIVIYYIGKKLFSKKVGIVAAFFTAINYRFVLSSTLALADGPAAFFSSLAVLFCLQILKKPTTRAYLTAAFFLALSFSVKNFVYAFPVFVVCHIFSVFGKRQRFTQKVRAVLLDKKLLLSIFVIIGVYFLINIYLILDYKNAHYVLSYNATRYRLDTPLAGILTFLAGEKNTSVIWVLNYLYEYGIGKVISICALLGLVYSLIRYHKQTIILLSIILPFLLVFMIISGTQNVRNYSSIIPIFLLFPAVFIGDLFENFDKKSLQIVFLIIIVLLVGFESLQSSFLSSLYFSRPQNLKEALDYARQNFSGKSGKVMAQTTDIPLSTVGILNPFIINAWGSDENLVLQNLQEKGIEYVFVGSAFTSLRNDQFYIGNKLLVLSSFDEKKKWEALANTHMSLTLQQLADYRVKEFVKPFWQGIVEPSFMVVKIPSKEEVLDQKLVKLFDFESETENIFHISSFFPCDWYQLSFVKGEGISDSNSLVIGNKVKPLVECAIQSVFSSEFFAIKPLKRYSLNGVAKRIGMMNEPRGDGFLRLDFYNNKQEIIKTFVSKQMKDVDGWQELKAQGLAPKESAFVRVGFQLDNTYSNLKIILDDLQVFESESKPINKTDYPFYNVPLPKNFMWQIQL